MFSVMFPLKKKDSALWCAAPLPLTFTLTLLVATWTRHGDRERLSLSYSVGNINLQSSSSIFPSIYSIINHQIAVSRGPPRFSTLIQ